MRGGVDLKKMGWEYQVDGRSKYGGKSSGETDAEGAKVDNQCR